MTPIDDGAEPIVAKRSTAGTVKWWGVVLRRQRARPGDKWHLDEVFSKIKRKTHYLWRAVDQDATVLDILITSRRDAKAATRFLRKPLRGVRSVPRVLITDKLAS
jgi:putative transposase